MIDRMVCDDIISYVETNGVVLPRMDPSTDAREEPRTCQGRCVQAAAACLLKAAGNTDVPDTACPASGANTHTAVASTLARKYRR